MQGGCLPTEKSWLGVVFSSLTPTPAQQSDTWVQTQTKLELEAIRSLIGALRKTAMIKCFSCKLKPPVSKSESMRGSNAARGEAAGKQQAD